ncbi:MAG: acyltransferase domain-containing protein, partial [Chloroflexota bacterium]|nr:acyltransferase domain-containing protein [Chloroflexota bacterium]
MAGQDGRHYSPQGMPESIDERVAMTEGMSEVSATDVAVIGMAGRFPGARNTTEFWRNLRDGVESVTRFSDEELRAAGVPAATLADPSYVKSGAILPDVELFDAGFFGFSPRDAAIMDPQHRHFLECTWEALEDAGHTADAFSGPIGVFAGSGMHAYLMYNLLTNPALVGSVGMFLLRHTGNDKDFLTTRASYLLNLRGPSINVQTACSTSLVAIHLACQSLFNGECDMALAGGVTIEVPHRQGYLYHEGEILSADGHCRAFDARSQGTIFGSGVGVVVLRRLEDALAAGDHIHAVIKGSAVNNDGSLKAGYLAPSVDGQAKAVAEALALSGVPAETISYVEAHGTGTPVGDPIEIAALTQAFRTQTEARGFCGVGSVKSNIGHLDTAAGVASFIKVAMALQHGHLPPSLHFKQPNPAIDFASSPFYINSRLAEWKPQGAPRRAGVNSLGVGGTNAFLILEQPPLAAPSAAGRPAELLVLSARSGAALDAATDNLTRHLQQHPELDLADVAFTLQSGRKAFPHRRVLAARDVVEAAAQLSQRDPKRVFTQRLPGAGLPGAGAGAVQRGEPPRRELTLGEPSVVFMFPGGAAQYPNMGRELYETEPVYRAAVDECLRLLPPSHLPAGPPAHQGDLKALMFPAPGGEAAAAQALEGPSVGLPAIFITEYALAQLWQSWGIKPAAMTGHSLGEYTCACLAGVMSLRDALALVVARGELFERVPPGAMVSVRLAEAELRPLLGAASSPESGASDGGPLDGGEPVPAGNGLTVAAVNAPQACVVSGRLESVAALERILEARGVEYNRLKITVAAHSELLEPFLEEFGRRVAGLQLHRPARPWISNLTGTWITPEQATDAGYWVRHLRQSVRFSDGIRELLQTPNRVFLEVGPGQTLSSLVKQHGLPAGGDTPAPRVVLSSTRHPQAAEPDVQFILTTLGRLWMEGVPVDWSLLRGTAGEEKPGRRRVPLPTYPFERQRHWIEPGRPLAVGESSAPPVAQEPTPPALTKLADLADWFSRPVWRAMPRPTLAASAAPAAPRNGHAANGASANGTAAIGLATNGHAPGGLHAPARWLVFAGQDGLSEAIVSRLRAAGHDVARVTAGAAFSRLEGGDYALDPSARADYSALTADLTHTGRAPQRIAHLWSLSPPGAEGLDGLDGLEGLESSQARGFYSLLFLAQALGQEDFAGPLHIGVVTDGLQPVDGDTVVRPERATLWGPCKVIPKEFPGITCQAIDIASGVAGAVHGSPAGLSPDLSPDLSPHLSMEQGVELIAEQIVDEVTAAADEPVVAFRGQTRWVERFERAPVSAPGALVASPWAGNASARDASPGGRSGIGLRKRGVYLITGGLGGIGLVQADYLARTVQARLILVGRHALPTREEWSAWLGAHSEKDAVSRRIRQVQA